MAQVTEFGKILRKMRIDSSEVLGDMAEKLGVSAAYLSAIEVGRRDIPENLIQKIVSVYNLGKDEERLLYEKKASELGQVNMDLGDMKNDKNYVQTAVMLSRDFSKLSGKQISEIKKMLEKL